MTKKRAKGSIGQVTITEIGKKLTELRDKHRIPPETSLKEAIDSAWRGFKIEWVLNKVNGNGQLKRQTTTINDAIEQNRKLAKEWLDRMDEESSREDGETLDGIIIDV